MSDLYRYHVGFPPEGVMVATHEVNGKVLGYFMKVEPDGYWEVIERDSGYKSFDYDPMPHDLPSGRYAIVRLDDDS